MDKPKPAHVIRFGRVKATIWANEGPNGPWHSVQVCRVYKDGDVWKQSDCFGRDDILLVCKAMNRAHTWIYQQAKWPWTGQDVEGSPAEAMDAPRNSAPMKPL